jgi:hypothetical protein
LLRKLGHILLVIYMRIDLLSPVSLNFQIEKNYFQNDMYGKLNVCSVLELC